MDCPWCGSKPKTVGQGLARPQPDGHFEWLCGSSKHGREPRQDVNCELNVEIAENATLTARVEWLQKKFNELSAAVWACLPHEVEDHGSPAETIAEAERDVMRVV